MTSNQFVINFINSLVTEFKNIKCSYSFEQYTDIHFIQLIPQTSYDDDKLIDIQLDIMDAFDQQFPSETLSFISENSLYKPSEFLFERAGDLYATNWFKVNSLTKRVKEPATIESNSPVFIEDYNYSIAA